MDVEGAGVVVTGAGHGIGRALARRMAAGGARVVVNDLDGAAATAIANELDGLAVPGNATSEEGVTALIGAARKHLGGIDVYFANAGIDVGGGIDAPEEDWSRALEVNLMGHVRAARALVPVWLGSAPYSVTKHASVAFAEWLSATYGHRGVTVQAVCPQGVRTRFLEAVGPAHDLLMHEQVLEPEQVADAVWEGLHDDRFLILPHPEVAAYYASRANDTDRWLRSMRRLQARLDAATS
jgi:NAD(P)-dependent dehydrogenase (short-subunit alcohol dehydrogenase family)